MTSTNKPSDVAYVVRFLGWTVVVLLSLSLPFVAFMMIPLLMCVAGACPASQHGTGWTIIAMIFAGYAVLSGCGLMAIRWAKVRLTQNAVSEEANA